MFKRIKDIVNNIRGDQLKEQVNKAYLPVDIQNDVTYKIKSDQLVNYIILKAIDNGQLGTVASRDVGNDANKIPYFRYNNTSTGIVRHLGMGRLTTQSQNSAFNKSFTTAGLNNGTSVDVARGNHTHGKLFKIGDDSNSHNVNIKFTGTQIKSIGSDDLAQKMNYQLLTPINPAINYKLYQLIDKEVLRPIIDVDKTHNTVIIVKQDDKNKTLLFDSIRFSDLNPNSQYILNVTFTDDGGIVMSA